MDIRLEIPDSLADITLSDYQKFMKIAEGKDIDIFVQQKMIQIFCKVPLLAVTHIKMQDFKKIVVHLTSVLEAKHELIPITTIQGKKYGFIPDLDKDMTFGEYIDLDTMMKTWETFDKAMSVLYRPVKSKYKGKYTIFDYDSNADASYGKLITMDVVTGATLFFWNLSKKLLQITPNYLQRLLKSMEMTSDGQKTKAVLEKNGVGIPTFIESLTETSLRLEQLLPQTWAKPLRF